MAGRYKSFLTPLSHVLAWMLVLCVLYLFRMPGTAEGVRGAHSFRGIAVVPLIGLFYWNAYFLVPRYLMKPRRTQYVLLAILSGLVTSGLCAAATTLYSYYGLDIARGSFFRIMGNRLFPSLLSMGASLGFGVLRENGKAEAGRSKKENEGLRAELAFLRSQVNPHFMLNTLNGMVALARKRSEQLEPALIELAAMMRYMLYDLDRDRVRLEEELDYLRSYINLQLLRFGSEVRVNFDVHYVNGDQLIEPMLLIPLVENAFKHGIGLIGEAEIEILINLSAENRLSMSVRNKFREEAGKAKEKSAGIGLINLKKRLTLIYPGNFELLTEKKNNWFVAILNLQLS